MPLTTATKPRIRYDPGSGLRDINFPWPVEMMKIRRFGAAQLHRARGPSIYTFGIQNFYDQLVMSVPRYAEDSAAVEAFNDAMVAFWSFAGRGGPFQFLINPAAAVLRTLTFAIPAGGDSVQTDNATGIGFVLIDSVTPYRLLNLINGDMEWVTFDEAGILPGTYLMGGRVEAAEFAYNVGDVLTDADSYGVMRVVGHVQPVRPIQGGLYTFDLSIAQSLGYKQPGASEA